MSSQGSPHSAESVLLLVVGMHRSGTSLVTELLHHLGAAAGDDLLGAQPGVNEHGFWEHRELVAIDEALLARLGRPWWDFRPLPARWWENPALGELQARARRFLERTFADAPLAVLKDPRLCRLLPFWRQAAGDRRVRLVMVQRDPRSVSASLCRRDPMVPEAALLLWLSYQREAEQHARHLPHARVDYDRLLEDPLDQLQRLGERLELEWPVAPSEAAEAIGRAVDPGLRHHRPPQEEAPGEPAATALEIHRRLLAGVTPQAAWERLDRWRAGCGPWLDALARSTGRAFELANRLQALGEEHATALATIETRDRQLTERTADWERLGKDLEHCRQVVETRDRQLAERTAEWERLGKDLEHCRQVVETRDRQLAELDRRHSELQQRLDRLLAHPAGRLLARWLRIERP